MNINEVSSSVAETGAAFVDGARSMTGERRRENAANVKADAGKVLRGEKSSSVDGSEGRITKTIESVTTAIPSGAFISAATISMGASAIIQRRASGQ